ncbi:hypothetical protein AVEN_163285-1 [Araneus ventricosus]|uniref:Uncharacterized protein n=1 Tax=Araneus ventricosus TaxID=182803 RepID=A0A4Y2LJK0_ARAVE|nr:hypothetical protein AVEN_163285-1 [Araneus ventricosus]
MVNINAPNRFRMTPRAGEDWDGTRIRVADDLGVDEEMVSEECLDAGFLESRMEKDRKSWGDVIGDIFSLITFNLMKFTL